MAASDVVARLAELEKAPISQQEKSSEYTSLLNSIIASSDTSRLPGDLTTFIVSVLGDSLGIVTTRPLLTAYVAALKGISSSDVKIEVGRQALQALEPRVVSFEEQDAAIREILADAYQEQGDYVDAAKALQGIQLESSQRKILDDTRVRTWIRICRLYLEEDDTTSAESYLNRAKNLLYKVNDRGIRLTFQLSQARILDSRRRFLDASQAYHSVSLSPALAEEERNQVLSRAIICAVLAPAGPQRSRSLGSLFKDERSVQQEEFGILEKMFLDRLISPAEVAKFADRLAAHQLAKMADGSTVLAKAVTEHNLLGVSKLYNNIGIAELGTLLGLHADQIEEYASRMLEQGRLKGRIDQIDGVLFFNGQDNSVAGTAVRILDSESKILRQWDSKVQGLADHVERVSSQLQSQFPVSRAAGFDEGCLTYN